MSQLTEGVAPAQEEDDWFDAACREAGLAESPLPTPWATELDPTDGASPSRAERRAALRRLVAGIVAALGLFALVVQALAQTGYLAH